MILAQIEFEDGTRIDTHKKWDMIYVSSDNILNPPTAQLETITYPEEDGEHVWPQTRLEPFDFNVKFLVQSKNANSAIQGFNESVFEHTKGSRTAKKVALIIPYKRLKLVGYFTHISKADKHYRVRGNEVQCVEVKASFRVAYPSECDFLYVNTKPYDMVLELVEIGENKFRAVTSRPIADDELLVRVTRHHYHNTPSYPNRDRGFYWHVGLQTESIEPKRNPQPIQPDSHDSYSRGLIEPWMPLTISNCGALRIKKARRSSIKILPQETKSAWIAYGVAVIKKAILPDFAVPPRISKHYQVSNIVFMREEYTLKNITPTTTPVDVFTNHSQYIDITLKIKKRPLNK